MLKFLLYLFTLKEDKDMLAMLFAVRIINGKTSFKAVPAKLQDQVREILVDAGCEDLAE